MQEERDAPVDVQIGPQLYENAPQELRSRLWIALLDNSTLATSVECSAVCGRSLSSQVLCLGSFLSCNEKFPGSMTTAISSEIRWNCDS